MNLQKRIADAESSLRLIQAQLADLKTNASDYLRSDSAPSIRTRVQGLEAKEAYWQTELDALRSAATLSATLGLFPEQPAVGPVSSPEEEEVAALLSSVYACFAAGEVMGPLHALSFALDDWLHGGARTKIEYLLTHADPVRLTIHGALAILTDTGPSQEHFPQRAHFAERALASEQDPRRRALLLRRA